MSLRDSKKVSKLVEKYMRDSRTKVLERDLMRRLIRVEHPELFHKSKNVSYASNLKQLDRKLANAFEKDAQKQIVESSEVKGGKLGFWGYRKWKNEFDAEQREKDIERLSRQAEELKRIASMGRSDFERELKRKRGLLNKESSDAVDAECS